MKTYALFYWVIKGFDADKSNMFRDCEMSEHCLLISAMPTVTVSRRYELYNLVLW